MKMRAALIIVLLMIGSAAAQSLTLSPPLIIREIPGGQAETVFVSVTNITGSTVNISEITGIKLTFPGSDWLGVTPSSLILAAGAEDTVTVIINKGGIFGSPGAVIQLDGRVLMVTDLPDPEDSLSISLFCSAGGIVWPTCCVGTRGNIDGDPEDAVDISDATALIDNLFIAFTPLKCWQEADCIPDGNIDIADLTCWISCMFIEFCPSYPMCPQ